MSTAGSPISPTFITAANRNNVHTPADPRATHRINSVDHSNNDGRRQSLAQHTAKCAKCAYQIGVITNAWNRVSNSYFTESFHHTSRDGLSLLEEGPARYPDSSNEQFEGW